MEKKYIVFIEEKTHKALKIMSAETGISMRVLTNSLLEKALEQAKNV